MSIHLQLQLCYALSSGIVHICKHTGVCMYVYTLYFINSRTSSIVRLALGLVIGFQKKRHIYITV
jgi:hypothetical protein